MKKITGALTTVNNELAILLDSDPDFDDSIEDQLEYILSFGRYKADVFRGFYIVTGREGENVVLLVSALNQEGHEITQYPKNHLVAIITKEIKELPGHNHLFGKKVVPRYNPRKIEAGRLTVTVMPLMNFHEEFMIPAEYLFGLTDAAKEFIAGKPLPNEFIPPHMKRKKPVS